MVTRIGEKYREAALALVAKAYSTIRIADLAVYLGQVNARNRFPQSLLSQYFRFNLLSQYFRLKRRQEHKWQPWVGLKNQEWSVLSFMLTDCCEILTYIQVTPKNERGKNATVPPTEDQLNRLTDFIAFLEN